ncbi:MAG: hypothetical protein KAH25_12295 [Bacteroidales bacterium]|nr:hypothetical protein [Bacteroidales bacterium]
MRFTLKFGLLIIFTCFQIQIHGQSTLDDIKLEQIEQKTIRKYVEHQIEDGKHQIYDIHPSWNRGDDLSSYNKNEMTFFLDASLQDVWQSYLSIDPTKLWDNRSMSKGLMLQKSPAKIFYDEDSSAYINTGQVYFLNLRLLSGIYNIAVAFEIITIDSSEMVLEFSYIEGNQSSGFQQLKFVPTDDNSTKIIHTSYFKSNSNFRDKWLYPIFHKKVTKDFHKNIKKILISRNIIKTW